MNNLLYDEKIAINCYGHFDATAGISEAARSNIKALADVDIITNTSSYNFDNEIIRNSDFNTRNKKSNINLIHINYDRAEDFINKNPQIFNDKNNYNIAYWAWEFQEVPKDVIKLIPFFNEIWVPSSFCVNAFSKVSTVPVICFPHPITPVKTIHDREHFNISENKYTFLTIFDSYSSILRKNPYAVIDAFEKAFGKKNTEVCLVIKSMNLEKFKEEHSTFKERIKEFSNIILINKTLEKPELSSLINNSDCLISLHRSEGFGLTMAEAMAYRKPVIATGYSGNLEFMNINNSYLVKSTPSIVSENYGSIKKGYIFVEPDIKHAIKLLKKVYSNQNKSEDVGRIAENYVKKELCSTSIGNKMKNRLEHIIQSENTVQNSLYQKFKNKLCRK